MLKSDAKSRSSGAGSFGRLRINPLDRLRINFFDKLRTSSNPA
jgi:hypothetical protein